MTDDREPLVLPQDEFELVRQVAEATGIAKPLAEIQTALRLRIAEGKLAAAEARLGEIRQAVETFAAVRGGEAAGDLAEGIRQILDRKDAP